MKVSRAVEALSAVNAFLMTTVAGAMLLRSESPLQVATGIVLLVVSLITVLLLPQRRLLTFLQAPVLPSALKIIGGAFCLAAAFITATLERPPLLSFSQLNAGWLVLVGCLLFIGTIPIGPHSPGSHS